MGEQEEGWRARGRPEAEGEERKIARAQTRPESPPRFTVYFSRISSSSSSSTIFRAEPNLLFNREKEMMNSNRSPFSNLVEERITRIIMGSVIGALSKLMTIFLLLA